MKKRLSGYLFLFIFAMGVCLMLNLMAIRATIDIIIKHPIMSSLFLLAIAAVGIVMVIRLK